MNDNERVSLKVVFLGNSGVGKTSVATRWITDQFYGNSKPTIGANHQRKTVKIDDQDVDLYLWDTAGQEQFQALTPLYARDAVSAVIMTSVTDQGSFDTVDTWVDLLNASCDEVPPMIMLVNKIDLLSEAVLSQDEILDKFNEKFPAVFFVSAVTGEGIPQALLHAAQVGYKFNLRKEKVVMPVLNENNQEANCTC